MHRVVIVGGGFGGLYAARALRRAPVEVTLVDRRNHHLFQPLLYQVATGTLSPANIAAPIRAVVRKQKNTEVFLAEVTQIDVARRQVVLDDGALPYDSLIVAAGSSHSYFGHAEWAKDAPGLKSIDDATEIRRRILLAFEAAERSNDAEERRRWLTIVIVGGGPTGVELAGAIAEIAQHTLRREFRRIDPSQARIIVLDAGSRILSQYAPKLSTRAQRSLEKLGVTVSLDSLVTNVEPGCVTVRRGNATEHIECRTVLWAAGVEASPLARSIADQTGAQINRSGQITVTLELTVPNHPEIFVIGDMAQCLDEKGQPFPALAPVAMQQGKHAARMIVNQIQGQPLAPFRYRDFGTMAVVGRFRAVADLRGFKFAGFFAWLLWLFVHLMYIVQFANRVLVLMQWAWHYTTWGRTARLITHDEPRTSRAMHPDTEACAPAASSGDLARDRNSGTPRSTAPASTA
jgi:NADH:ubiquinone reductase (H+-translocating)